MAQEQFNHGQVSFTYQCDNAGVSVLYSDQSPIILDRVGPGYGTPKGVFPVGLAEAVDALCEVLNEPYRVRRR
jgi:hypothetical protein